MTLLLGDTGKISVGNLRTFTLSNPTVQETYLSSNPIILPTVEPTVSQVSYTVQASDFPVVTPSPVAMANAPLLHVAGKAVTACTLSYKVLRNGATITTGTNAVTANNSWTYSIVNSNMLNVVVGDVLEVKVWSTQVDTQLDYYALTIYPTRICLAQPNTILRDLTFSGSPTSASHTLLQGRSPSANANQSNACVIYMDGGVKTTSFGGTGNLTMPAVPQLSTVVTTASTMAGQLCIYYGDVGLRTSVSFRQHSTMHPYYERNVMPSTISFREIIL